MWKLLTFITWFPPKLVSNYVQLKEAAKKMMGGKYFPLLIDYYIPNSTLIAKKGCLIKNKEVRKQISIRIEKKPKSKICKWYDATIQDIIIHDYSKCYLHKSSEQQTFDTIATTPQI